MKFLPKWVAATLLAFLFGATVLVRLIEYSVLQNRAAEAAIRLGAFKKRDRRELYEFLSHIRDMPQVRAFLDMVAWAEGTTRIDESGYRVQYSHRSFSCLERHPSQVVIAPSSDELLKSSASGRYQFLTGTWCEVSRVLSLSDFSAKNQDIAALYLIYKARALSDLLQGRIERVIAKTSRIWASFPGAPYGQPTHPRSELIACFYWGYWKDLCT